MMRGHGAAKPTQYVRCAARGLHPVINKLERQRGNDAHVHSAKLVSDCRRPNRGRARMSSTRPGSGVAPELALARALPQLVAAEQRLRALAEREGITYNVADFGGLRTQADTTLILQYRDADYK